MDEERQRDAHGPELGGLSTPIAPAEVARPLAVVLVVLFLLPLVLVPAARHLTAGFGAFAAFRGELAGVAAELRAGEPLAANRRALAAIDGLEERLEEGSPVRERVLPPVQALLVRYGGVGNESAYVGHGGWLVYRPGFDYLTGPPFLDPAVRERRWRQSASWRSPPMTDPRPALVDFARQLRRRGIEMLVVTVPTKPMIHPETLAPELEGAGVELQNPSFDTLRRDLEEAGVAVLDAAPTLRELATRQPAFLETDSHWSPAAVEAVAAAVADRLAELVPDLGLIAPLRRQELPHQGTGDLARLLRLPESQTLYPQETVTVGRVTTPDGRLWQPDPRAEILLMGDSFANVYSQGELGWGRGAGLAEQLAYRLGRPVDRIAINDGSATATRRRLADELAAGRDRLAGKKVVIYQFAVRELATGDWQVVELPPG